MQVKEGWRKITQYLTYTSGEESFYFLFSDYDDSKRKKFYLFFSNDSDFKRQGSIVNNDISQLLLGSSPKHIAGFSDSNLVVCSSNDKFNNPTIFLNSTTLSSQVIIDSIENEGSLMDDILAAIKIKSLLKIPPTPIRRQ